MIPETIEQSIIQLNNVLNPEDKKYYLSLEKEQSLIGATHNDLGRWIRNYWGLWTKGPLYEEFIKLGIIHPDSMSSFIILKWWEERKGSTTDTINDILDTCMKN